MEKIVLSQNNVNLVRYGRSLLYFVEENFEGGGCTDLYPLAAAYKVFKHVITFR